jgi:hypothetical protein
MADTPQPPAPLQFEASFPCDARFAPILCDLGARMAQSLGYEEADARALGQEIEQAFAKAAAGRAGDGQGSVCVTLRAVGNAIDATILCASGTVLEFSRPPR